jgi:hypothetical protein
MGLSMVVVLKIVTTKRGKVDVDADARRHFPSRYNGVNNVSDDALFY